MLFRVGYQLTLEVIISHGLHVGVEPLDHPRAVTLRPLGFHAQLQQHDVNAHLSVVGLCCLFCSSTGVAVLQLPSLPCSARARLVCAEAVKPVLVLRRETTVFILELTSSLSRTTSIGG